jgi:hypothetical protein
MAHFDECHDGLAELFNHSPEGVIDYFNHKIVEDGDLAFWTWESTKQNHSRPIRFWVELADHSHRIHLFRSNDELSDYDQSTV